MKQKLIIIVCLIVMGFGGWRLLSSDLISQGTIPAGVRVMDAQTGHRFHKEIGPGFKGWPVKSPDSGEMTGYPVEVCYWNECGRREGGTWVILNELLGQPGPTKCPECGHVVVGHNPIPAGYVVDPQGNLRPRPESRTAHATPGQPEDKKADEEH